MRTRKLFGVAVLWCGVMVNWVAGESAAAPARPNIVFILADDLGYADLACYGRRDIRTPAIDRIAAEGVRLTQCYANSPVCSPARVALMTGRYPQRLRFGLEEPLATANTEQGLPPDHPTLPSLLKGAGYRTMLVGKWHLGALPKFGPRQSGYEKFFGFRAGAVDYFFHGSGQKRDLWNDDEPVQRPGYLTDLLGQRAVDAVGELARGGAPFLLSLHFSAPHWPWEGPGDEAESRRLQAAAGNLLHLDGGSQKTYREMVEAMDRQVGCVLAALEAHGLRENTILVFTSDNGGERFSDTWPLTGRKTELLEGGLRVPAVVSWPARIPRGRESGQVMATMDWLPTLLAAAGVAPAVAFPPDGTNLLPQLAGEAAPVARTLFFRYKANGQRAVRDGDFKFLRILENTYLFNVTDDPMERANLKARLPDVTRRLEGAWFDWNATMLPEIADSYAHAFDGATLADHYGAKKPDGKPEVPRRPED